MLISALWVHVNNYCVARSQFSTTSPPTLPIQVCKGPLALKRMDGFASPPPPDGEEGKEMGKLFRTMKGATNSHLFVPPPKQQPHPNKHSRIFFLFYQVVHTAFSRIDETRVQNYLFCPTRFSTPHFATYLNLRTCNVRNSRVKFTLEKKILRVAFFLP